MATVLKRFYQTVINSEDNAIAFLYENNLLIPEDNKVCCRCGCEMEESKKRDINGEFKSMYRCKREECSTSKSIRKGNSFLYFIERPNEFRSLNLSEILELILFFILEMPVDVTTRLTGKSEATVNEWFDKCREICKHTVSIHNRGQMIGTKDDPIMIDSLILMSKTHLKRVNNEESYDDEDDYLNQKDNMNGPCIFGMKKGRDCRYIFSKGRDESALVPIIEEHCQKGSVIESDQWVGYENLNKLGYTHLTKDEMRADLTPTERAWLDNKYHFLKRTKSITNDKYQLHLDQVSWKILRKDSDNLLLAFLNDIRNAYE